MKFGKLRFKTLLFNFVRDEMGQSTTEYILILSVVVMIALKFKNIFGSQLSNLLNKVGGQMSEAASDSGG